MTSSSHLPRSTRHRLLGSTGAVLAIMLASSPASAQVATAQASGVRTLANQQNAPSGTTRGAARNTADQNITAGGIDHSSLAVTDNSISGVARSNQAVQEITASPLALDDHVGGTSLTAGPAEVSAHSATVIANRQSTTDTLTYGDILGSTIGLDAGAVSNSRLTLTGNTQEGLALGNDASAIIALTGPSADSGAGIASSQTAGSNGLVAAQARGLFALDTGPVASGNLANNNNLERAIASGNAADNGVSATIAAVTTPSSIGDASVVPTVANGDPVVTANYGILAHQIAGGTVRAQTGDTSSAPAIRTAIGGDIANSSVSTDTNTLIAAAYGSQSANKVALDTLSIAGAPGNDGPAGGAVADITSVQLARDATIEASAQDGLATDVDGAVSGSSLSTSGNSIQTVAAGNLASGNELTVHGGAIDAIVPALPGAPSGTALVKGPDNLDSNAAFSIQSVQDYGSSSISASQADGGVKTAIGGAIDGSAVKTQDNLISARATGNDATNQEAIDAPSLHSTAAVNSLQSGEGNITTTLGAPNRRSGAMIHVGDAISGSTLSDTGNELTGTAIGQYGKNTLSVSANRVAASAANGAANGAADAGATGTSYGASGTVALASNQRLGMPSNGDTLTPAISSSVFGEAGISGGETIDGSSLTVDGNTQRADALGNSSLNRLAIAAPTVDTGVGSALSSYQYGQATVAATSDATWSVSGALAASDASLTGNMNVARGTVNEAGNAIDVDAESLGRSSGGAAVTSSNQLGPPKASGDVAMTNQQFATGSASATATTHLDSGTANGLDASRSTVADNLTSADVAANHALNAVLIDHGLDGRMSVGLVNEQTSLAYATASALTDAGNPASRPINGALSGSSVTLDGNTTSALARGNAADNSMTLSGTAASSESDAVAHRYDVAASAPAALVNAQTNYGQVIATAADTVYQAPLNGPGAVDRSAIGVTGNSVAAGAYGNIAGNSVTVSGPGQSPGAAVTNLQTNYAAVFAQITQAENRVSAGLANESTLSITGNQLAATAVGNQATNLIAATR